MNHIRAKELAARILKCGTNRVYLSPDAESNNKIVEAMTKDDIRTLIAERIIKKRAAVDQSMGRARALKVQMKKGRRRGKGKRTGTKKTRTEQRDTWIGKVRAQRRMLRELRVSNPKAVEEKGYQDIYRKIKGNYFKGKNYVKDYVEGGKAQ